MEVKKEMSWEEAMERTYKGVHRAQLKRAEEIRAFKKAQAKKIIKLQSTQKRLKKRVNFKAYMKAVGKMIDWKLAGSSVVTFIIMWAFCWLFLVR